jgi:hypothetical protein
VLWNGIDLIITKHKFIYYVQDERLKLDLQCSGLHLQTHLSALDPLNLDVVVQGGNVDGRVIHLQCLLLEGDGIGLGLERSINNPVHSLARIAHEETDGSSEDTAWEEGKPDDLVGVGLGLVECGEAGAEDLSVDSGDLVEALTGEVEADELTNVFWVKSEREYSADCANDVSTDQTVGNCFCHLLIASGI